MNEKYQGIVVEFFLQKPLTGNLLTQFLPTTLFIIIRKQKIEIFLIYFHLLTNYSQVVLKLSNKYIDMVIEVNLTILLVLTTL